MGLNSSSRMVAVWLFLGLFVVYQINGDYYPMLDAMPSMLIAESILNEGNLSLSPPEMPDGIEWTLHGRNGSRRIELSHIDGEVSRLYEAGILTLSMEHCISGRCVPTIHEGLFVSTFSPGAGITALPVFAALRPWTGPVADHPVLAWYAAKVVASVCVAGSAALLFMTAVRFVAMWPALVVSLSYGLGTCVWSTGSQALWQHGPNEFYLSLGIYFLARIGEGPRLGALCGLAFAAATWCRPTGALIVAAVGVYLLLVDRRTFAAYVLAGLPLGIALFSYGMYYFGSPMGFGQLKMQEIAIYKTGSSEIWQTAWWYGLFALMFNPSRGLLVFSPFLVFSFFGVVAAWRDRRFVWLRPLSIAVLAIWLVESRHFDWWGGWSYGYRHIVDTVPMLCAFLVPIISAVLGRRLWLALYVPMVVWSIFVQILGAFAYNLDGWNARRALRIHGSAVETPFTTLDFAEFLQWHGRPGVQVEMIGMNIDLPKYRYRLWSICDSQIVYYATHWTEARQRKWEFAAELSKDHQTRRAETHLALGNTWLDLREFDRAIESFRTARSVRPNREDAWIGEGLALAMSGHVDEAIELYRQQIRAGLATYRTYSQLGVAYLASGDTPSAIAAFHEASAADLSEGMASCVQALEQWRQLAVDTPNQRAVIPFDRTMQAQEVMDAIWQAAAALRKGESESARKHYETALELDAELPTAINGLGLVALEHQELDLAEQQFRKSLELDPQNAEAHEHLGIVYMRRREPELARPHFEMARDVGLHPDRLERYLQAVDRLIRRTQAEGSAATPQSADDAPATTKSDSSDPAGS